MSEAKKVVTIRSKDNKHNAGSVSLGGKTAPKADPRAKSSLSKKGSKLPDPTLPKVTIKVPEGFRSMNGDELDVIQEREDYLNIFEDMGYSFAEDMEVNAELKSLFRERVKAYAQSTSGKKELQEDLELLVQENPNSERDFRVIVIREALASNRA